MSKKGWSPLHGIICLWSGAIADIPDGWVLCDGTNGTPNLQDRFLVGSGHYYVPHLTGGLIHHTHVAAVDPRPTWLDSGDKFIDSSPDGDFTITSIPHNHPFTLQTIDHRPPYYSLAYIMKL